MKRQPNGRFRGANSAAVLTDEVLRARWVEAETLRLKTMGFSFQEIAEHRTGCAWDQSPTRGYSGRRLLPAPLRDLETGRL
jgi:hypothetical protein